MSIYTKTGDDGTTGRPGGRRVSKADPLVAANGAIDELNSQIGWALCPARARGMAEIVEALRPVQPDLLIAGAMVAALGGRDDCPVSLGTPAVQRLEESINRAESGLPPLSAFIVPGGSEPACRLHVARTACRRAERAAVAARQAGADLPPVVLAYLNRLSDLLFVLARRANRLAGLEDEPWRQ